MQFCDGLNYCCRIENKLDLGLYAYLKQVNGTEIQCFYSFRDCSIFRGGVALAGIGVSMDDVINPHSSVGLARRSGFEPSNSVSAYGNGETQLRPGFQ